MLPQAALLGLPEPSVAPSPASTAVAEKVEKIDLGMTQPLEMLPEAALLSIVPAVTPPPATEAAKPSVVDISPTQSLELPASVLPPGEPTAVVIPLPPIAAPVVVTAPVAVAPEPTIPSDEFGGLTLMATGAWPAMQRATETKDSDTQPELNGPETLSLITKPAPAATEFEPTLQLALLPDPVAEPKRAANGE